MGLEPPLPGVCISLGKGVLGSRAELDARIRLLLLFNAREFRPARLKDVFERLPTLAAGTPEDLVRLGTHTGVCAKRGFATV